MALDRTKFIARFAEEAREHIAKINEGLLSLEKNPDDMETMNAVFRGAHTIKGSSRMLKLNAISEVSHKLEDALDALRGKRIQHSKAVFDVFFRGIDIIGELVEKTASGQDITTDTSGICGELEKASKGEITPSLEKSPSFPPLKKGDEGGLKEGRGTIHADPAILSGFCEESIEALKSMETDISSLEKNPGDMDLINHIFRAAHSIKGGALFLNLFTITDLMHSVENLMSRVRDGFIHVDSQIVDILFHSIDILKTLLNAASEGRDERIDIRDIVSRIDKAARDGEGTLREKEPQRVMQECPAPLFDTKSDEKGHSVKSAKPKTDATIRVAAERIDDVIKLAGEMLSNQSRLRQRLFDIKEIERIAKKSAEAVMSLQDNLFAVTTAQAEAISRGEIRRCARNDILAGINPPSSPFSKGGKEGDFSKGGMGDVLDIDAHRDEIINTAQMIHSNIRHLAGSMRDDLNLQELLTGEMQERALSMRMLPLSTIFDTFHRAVRDISKPLGKKVELVIEGGDTEIDKKIIEKIGDPLIHMIRNSIDHGIEAPEERLNAGKPETGVIRLSASYEGGNVLIEITDDGRGIPLKKIKEKALHKKLFDEEALDKMSESEIIDLIFQPGFSTAPIITDLSGRGVGMDVVKKNIVDELKGSLHTQTKEGKGTGFSIRLPLTISIMRLLLFTVQDAIFAITAASIDEIIRVHADEIIDVVDKKAVRLREQIIPVVKLGEVLNLPSAVQQPLKSEKDHALIIIVYMGGEKLGLIIDSLLDEEDMVIKPLPAHMKNIQWVSGVIITGKNEVVNVLNCPAIIKSAKEMKGTLYKGAAKEEKRQISILVVDDSINTREIEKDILESYGYKVEIANDGIEALGKTGEIKYDLIITDIEMPRMDGFSLVEKLRKDEGYKDTPIIIVTSRDKEEDKKRGIQVGADAYIVKGAFDQSNLLETVENLVG